MKTCAPGHRPETRSVDLPDSALRLAPISVLSFLSYFFWVAIALGVLVFVHELGHFLFARLFKMRVDAFSIGFPPNILKKQVGETEYRLGAIPLGGYVKIAGMLDESLEVPYELEPVLDDAGRPVLGDDGEPLYTEKLDARGKPIPMESEPQPDEYRSKPVWQRVLVISGGVIFNFIFAWLIFAGLKMVYGQPVTPPDLVRFEIEEGSLAEGIGLRTGDRIVGVNGEALEAIEDLETMALTDPDLALTVLRGRDTVEVAGQISMTEMSRKVREIEDAGETPDLASIVGMTPLLPPVLSSVGAGSAADEAGLRPGDRIVRIGRAEIRSWNDLTEAVGASGGEPVTIRWARPDSLITPDDPEPLVVMRGNTIYEAEAAPRPSGDGFVLGVGQDRAAMGVSFRTYGPIDALTEGATETVATTAFTFSFVGRLFTGRESFKENVGGPLIIAKQAKEAADMGAYPFWRLVAMLSIALAVFNILPIPVLDGGHLVFLFYEGITRREPSLKVRMVVQQVGMAAILALMAFVLFNDAVRWFG